MTTKFYLHIKENGSTRTTKNKAATYTDEISILMEVSLPEQIFEKPLIQGKITISNEMVTPRLIDAEISEEVKNAIQSIDGVKVELIMPEIEL